MAKISKSAHDAVDGDAVHPRVVDIVIPTHNEGDRLGLCLDALISAGERMRTKITDAPGINFIVADAGSEDGTVAVAQERGAIVVGDLPLSRGCQLRRGVAVGSGEVVLMLHADSRMHADGLWRLVDCLDHRPALAWGILGGRFDRRTLKMKFLESLNRWRFRIGGIAFGDQGIFARRECLESCGGVPDIPLMEDVELSLRLGRCGRRCHVGPLLEVSARRWDSKPFIRSSCHVIGICLEYVVRRKLGGNIHSIATRMYREYYGRDPAVTAS